MTTPPGAIPMFPLPNVILFPEMVLPLHIFEPRYRQMVETALAGERKLAMALLKPGWEEDYYGQPPVYDVVGLGDIVQDRRLEDGRFHIVVRGTSRGRIVEVVQEGPFRTVRVDPLSDHVDPSRFVEMEKKRQRLLIICRAAVDRVFQDPSLRPDPDLELGPLCDKVAAILNMDIAERQQVLEETDVNLRADRVLRLLERPQPSKKKAPPPSWPPGFSEN